MKIKKDISFSTKFEDHQGLIHKLTKKCWGRLKDVGLHDHEYEDVFQINCMTYVKAARKYEPERGITFSAYLGRAIYNQFNQHADNIIREKLSLNLQSYEDFKTDGDDDSFDFMSIYVSDGIVENNVEHAAILKQESKENIRKLSNLGKLVIRELISPSISLKKSFTGMKAHSEMAKKQGVKFIRPPQSINFRAIKLHYGLCHRDMVSLRKEFNLHLGVNVG